MLDLRMSKRLDSANYRADFDVAIISPKTLLGPANCHVQIIHFDNIIATQNYGDSALN